VTLEKCSIKSIRSRGFQPRRCGSPDAITPGQCYVIIGQRRGRYGGTGTCPLLHRTSILNFIVKEKEFFRAEIVAVFKWIVELFF
jgi:hypothetical protein